MKIVCGTICKNEDHNIPGILDNLCNFGITEFFVVDTGSVDNSLELLRNSNKVSTTIKQVVINPFNFSEARNYLKDMIPYDADFVLHLDMDERIKSLPTNLIIGSGYSGDREEKLYGMISKCIHRITPKSGWTWTHPIHESLHVNYDVIYDNTFVIEHYQKPGKDCYESLTEFYFKVDPERLYFHRLTDLIHNSRYEEFIDLFRKHGTWILQDQQKWLATKNYQTSLLKLKLPADSSFFDVLVDANSSSSWYYLFLCYDSIGNYSEASRFLYEAINGSFPKENEIKYFNRYVKDRALRLAQSKINIYNLL